jgi:molecular chaperone DnaK
MSKIIGIDFGASNVVMSVLEGEKPKIILQSEGNKILQAVFNHDKAFSSIKRRIGEQYKVTIDGKDYTPIEILSIILQKLKADAEAYLGETVSGAVITVPAKFDYTQRSLVMKAGEIAGFELVRVLTDSTAVALAYGFDKNIDDETVLTLDFGSDSLSVSILEIIESTFDVQAANGDNRFGGNNFDRRIVNWIIEQFEHETGIDLFGDKIALTRLAEVVEKAKIELDSMTSTNINLPFITADASGPKHLDLTLSRAKFDELTRDLVERTIEIARATVEDAYLSFGDIDKIILVGGSSKIPAVQNAVREFFGKEIFINSNEYVSMGAAVHGSCLSGEVPDILLLDVTPLSLGIETLGGVCTKIIDRNTTIPVSKSQVFSYCGG